MFERVVSCVVATTLSFFVLGVTYASSPLDDVIIMRDGSKLVCHVIAYEPSSYRVRTSVLNGGEERVIRITQIASIKFGEPATEPAMTIPKTQLSQPPVKVSASESATKMIGEELASFGTIAFMRAGVGDIDSNSQPFILNEPVLYIAGIRPVSEYGFSSINVDGTGDSELIGGIASTNDFESEGADRCVAKIDYSGGEGEGYANVSAQEGEWFVAVINLSRVPRSSEIEVLCRSLMKRLGWPSSVPVQQ